MTFEQQKEPCFSLSDQNGGLHTINEDEIVIKHYKDVKPNEHIQEVLVDVDISNT